MTLDVCSFQSSIYSFYISRLVSASHCAMDIALVKASRMLKQWAVLLLSLLWESL